jgi:hypothetical protein
VWTISVKGTDPGWPDELVKKISQSVTQRGLVKIRALLLPRKVVAQNFVCFCNFQKNCPKKISDQLAKIYPIWSSLCRSHIWRRWRRCRRCRRCVSGNRVRSWASRITIKILTEGAWNTIFEQNVFGVFTFSCNFTFKVCVIYYCNLLL